MSANRFNFRAWNHKHKQMLQVAAVYSDSRITTKREYIPTEEEAGKLTPPYKHGVTTEYEDVSVDENTSLMQSTGMVDKNGKEIFEGDIVKLVQIISSGYDSFKNEEVCVQVVWDEAMWCIAQPRVEPDNGDRWTEYIPLYCDNDRCEVVGNIHQNKDLLT